MTLALDDGDVRIYLGDALDQLATLPSESVQCIVTSPPFWALRDYGVDGQIGLEATPDEWCERLVGVFRECRRVLRHDGVLWLECGDTYAANSGTPMADGSDNKGGVRGFVPNAWGVNARTPRTTHPFKPKDLVGAPWMLAFALRNDGWYLRSDTIWARPNPMPESVTDRPTKAHSYVFLLTKSPRYYYDASAIAERSAVPARATKNIAPEAARNSRSVWSIPTEPTPFQHFATFPQALVERCIKAGTSERGACSDCGSPWTREVERTAAEPVYVTGKNVHNADRNDKGRTMFVGGDTQTSGWSASCACDAPIVPCRVLDPFMGSGTTALVARRLGRHAIGIELNASYLAIAAKRLQQLSLLGGSA